MARSESRREAAMERAEYDTQQNEAGRLAADGLRLCPICSKEIEASLAACTGECQAEEEASAARLAAKRTTGCPACDSLPAGQRAAAHALLHPGVPCGSCGKRGAALLGAKRVARYCDEACAALASDLDCTSPTPSREALDLARARRAAAVEVARAAASPEVRFTNALLGALAGVAR